jgi:assimilatory nitrate reductase catalytic subunit
MTRSGKSPRLSAHVDEPIVSVHPVDAARFSLVDGGFARITTMHGTTVLRVRESSDQRTGEIFAPIHWSAENSSDGRVGALVQPACDPISGQPELKATAASLAPVVFATHGFVLSRASINMAPGTWWARSAVAGGFGYRVSAASLPSQWSKLTRELLGLCDGLIELNDETQSRYRAALIQDGQLQACVFLASSPAALPSWDWLKSQLAMPQLSTSARRALLAGRSPDTGVDHGPVVCACFGVGRNEICKVISRYSAAVSAETIGRELRAGTNCGSCLPELRRLIANGQAMATVGETASS